MTICLTLSSDPMASFTTARRLRVMMRAASWAVSRLVSVGTFPVYSSVTGGMPPARKSRFPERV